MNYTPPTPVSPNSLPNSAYNSPYTTYSRPTHHHRKRISALRLSSDTTSTLPEYNPNSASVTPWRTVPEVTEIDDAPPGYSSDSAEEADEDTDISDAGSRSQAQRSVFVTVGFNSAPPSTSTFTSPSTPRTSRIKRGPSHRRRRSNPVNLDPQSNSDLYLDSLLERSVHALEMSNALLQSSISTKTTLSGILNQETDSEEGVRSMAHSPMPPRPGSGSGIYSLERSAQELSSRITSNRNVHETWVEDLEQISRDVDLLFSEDAQERRRNRRHGSSSSSSQGSVSASLPTTSSPLQSYRHHLTAGSSHPRSSKRATRRASLDFGSSQTHFSQSVRVEHSEQYDEMTGVPHLRYDVPDRERFVAHPPRALTQYVVVEGDVRHGHEDRNASHRHHSTEAMHARRDSDDKDKDRRNVGTTRNLMKVLHQEPESPRNDETIVLPSTLGLRVSGTHSTIRSSKQSSRSRSRSPGQTSSTVPPSASRITTKPPPSSSSHQFTRAPHAYNMLSSFVYPVSSSASIPKRSNSTSSLSRKDLQLGPRRRSANAAATERPNFESTPSKHYSIGVSKRRHSTSPAASTTSTRTSTSGSSTITAGSASRSRSQTPKPLGSGFPSLPSSSLGRRNMTPPMEASGSGGEGTGRASSEPGEESENSSDSCPTKQTILSLRKILDANPPAEPSHNDWTLISKPPRLLQQSLKVGIPVEAGTSTATASISKLFTQGVHSHEGSVTRHRNGEQRMSSFKGKGKASASNSAVPSAPATPPIISPASTPSRMNFGKSLPDFLSSSVALALGASSPLSSKPSSGSSTPVTPGHSKRISFAELPEGTQGTGPQRQSKKRKGKQTTLSRQSGIRNAKARASRKRNTGDDEGDESKGWLGWLIGISGVDNGRSDKPDDRLGKVWGGYGLASRGPGYGNGLDEWGI
ncbi:hypothetical protein GYMLUDRAFT_92567 [Collybiopsis luxurians FD-317 M1]|nr:hypothetical protein GYMLUDRAFT_92567 [Collybiopsis luxurians FD-317 M1]